MTFYKCNVNMVDQFTTVLVFHSTYVLHDFLNFAKSLLFFVAKVNLSSKLKFEIQWRSNRDH